MTMSEDSDRPGLDDERMDRLRAARDRLSEQLIGHAGIGLIDIGLARVRDQPAPLVALRVHVSRRWADEHSLEQAGFPKEIDGVPVVIMIGDYRPEEHT
jgi:hypothetical protein